MENKLESNVSYSVLDSEKIGTIHEKSMEVLETIGVKVGGDIVLKLLVDNGCSVGEDGYIRIPRALVEKCLKSVPKSLTLYDRDGNPNMVIDSRNQKYFGSIGDGMEYYDPETKEIRKYTLDDSVAMCKLCDALEDFKFIVFTGVYYGERTEVHNQLFYYNVIRNFSKTISLSTNSVEELKVAIQISEIIAGGKEKLAEKPFVFHYCEPIPPLLFPYDSTERIRLAAEAGIPIVSMPYSMMGGTAPMSGIMALIQNNVEVLAGLVISQLVRPGVGYIYGSMPTIMDMKSTIGSYAAPEFHLNINASAEMADHYGIPFFGTYGVSDSRTLDMQSAAEGMMEAMNVILGKQNLIHDVGMIDHGSVMNPLYLLFSDECIKIAKAYAKGITIDEDDLDLDIFERNKGKGNYLEDDHTLDNFGNVYYSDLFSRKMTNPDESEIIDKLTQQYRDILENHKVTPLDEKRLTELEAFLEQYKIKDFYK